MSIHNDSSKTPENGQPGLDERFAAWVDGELSPAELAQLEAEMAADPEVRAEAEQYAALVSALRDHLPEAAPPDFADRVVARLPQESSRPKGGRLLPFAASIGAAAAMVGLFFVLRHFDQDSPTVREQAQAQPPAAAWDTQDGVETELKKKEDSKSDVEWSAGVERRRDSEKAEKGNKVRRTKSPEDSLPRLADGSVTTPKARGFEKGLKGSHKEGRATLEDTREKKSARDLEEHEEVEEEVAKDEKQQSPRRAGVSDPRAGGETKKRRKVADRTVPPGKAPRLGRGGAAKKRRVDAPATGGVGAKKVLEESPPTESGKGQGIPPSPRRKKRARTGGRGAFDGKKARSSDRMKQIQGLGGEERRKLAGGGGRGRGGRGAGRRREERLEERQDAFRLLAALVRARQEESDAAKQKALVREQLEQESTRPVSKNAKAAERVDRTPRDTQKGRADANRDDVVRSERRQPPTKHGGILEKVLAGSGTASVPVVLIEVVSPPQPARPGALRGATPKTAAPQAPGPAARDKRAAPPPTKPTGPTPGGPGGYAQTRTPSQTGGRSLAGFLGGQRFGRLNSRGNVTATELRAVTRDLIRAMRKKMELPRANARRIPDPDGRAAVAGLEDYTFRPGDEVYQVSGDLTQLQQLFEDLSRYLQPAGRNSWRLARSRALAKLPSGSAPVAPQGEARREARRRSRSALIRPIEFHLVLRIKSVPAASATKPKATGSKR